MNKMQKIKKCFVGRSLFFMFFDSTPFAIICFDDIQLFRRDKTILLVIITSTNTKIKIERCLISLLMIVNYK